MREYSFIIKTNKMLNKALFMKRVMNLTIFLKKRYNIVSEECHFNYFFHDKDNKEKLTITLNFEL